MRESRAKRQAREILADPDLISRKEYQRESVCRAFTVLIRQEICPSDPRRALPLAFACLRLTRRVPRAAARRCLIGSGWATVGTIYRVLADHNRAEKCYLFAVRRADRCRCGRCRPDVLRRLAYLRICQGRREEAKHIADEAIAACRAADDSMLLGRVLLAAASAEFHLGKISNAITGARSALRLIPPADPLYYLAGLHNLAWYVSHTDSRDDLKEALETLEHAWKSVRGRTKPYRTIRIRIRSARAVVRYRLGKLRPCHLRQALNVAHRQLCDLSLYRDAAQLTAEAVEVCAEMRAEDDVDLTLRTLCDRLIHQDLPNRDLPSRTRGALSELRRAVGGVAREPLRRAASELLRVCVPCSVPGVAGIG